LVRSEHFESFDCVASGSLDLKSAVFKDDAIKTFVSLSERIEIIVVVNYSSSFEVLSVMTR